MAFVMSVCAALAFGVGCATDARPDSVDDEPQYSTSEVEQDIGTDPPGCSGVSMCYCLCRVQHPCATNPAQCSPLGQCLTSCDQQYPGCTPGGNQHPTRIQDCF